MLSVERTGAPAPVSRMTVFALSYFVSTLGLGTAYPTGRPRRDPGAVTSRCASMESVCRNTRTLLTMEMGFSGEQGQLWLIQNIKNLQRYKVPRGSADTCEDRISNIAGSMSCKAFLRSFAYQYCRHKYIKKNCCASHHRFCSGSTHGR